MTDDAVVRRWMFYEWSARAPSRVLNDEAFVGEIVEIHEASQDTYGHACSVRSVTATGGSGVSMSLG